MLHRLRSVLSLSVLCFLAAAAKDKKKVILPADVLQAQSVLVVIDPDAGTSIEDPLANRTARNNVEKALMDWGRFRLALNVANADLVISVRKGSGRVAQPTIGGIPDDRRPVILQPSQSGPRLGGQTGIPPAAGDPTAEQPRGPRPQAEIGQSEDTFLVYRGQRENALDFPPVWRYIGKDALRSPGVPAVDQFRRAILEAEKQQINNP